MEKCDCASIDNSQAQTRRTQAKIQADCALELLKSGNNRFVNKMTLRRDLKWQAEITSSGQFPFAVVLSCLDSRVPTELVFDQGIGDVFNARVAGNFVNDDILGSIEFAYASGVSLVLVLGHTQCGAINAAINNSENGPNNCEPCKHIIPMVKNLYPAVKNTNRHKDEEDRAYQNRVARKNVELNIQNIRNKSDCLRTAEKKKEIAIVGGIYDVASGVVSFFEHPKSQIY